MQRIIMTIGFMATLASGFSLASEVTEGVDTKVFTDGEAALAADVNDNFGTLIAAINDNASRIEALEQATGDVSGRSYMIFSYETGVINVENQNESPFWFQEKISVTFNGDGTANVSLSGVVEAQVDKQYDEQTGDELFPSIVLQTGADETFSNVTWSQTGNEVEVFENGSSLITFMVGPGGGSLMRMDYSHEVDSGIGEEAFFSTLFIGVEVP